MPKKVFLVLFLILSFYTYSQNKKGHSFGELLDSEINLKIYDKDSTANAVVLYEKGDNYFKVINGYVKLVKDYHVKIKVFNTQGFDQSIISIPFYHNDKSSEKVIDIKAITHNDGYKKHLSKSQIFTKDLSERWKETTFTFPDVKEGSILEYKYTYISPFFFNFSGWEFQSDIPKIYSEFNAKIPGNYVYNRILKGYQKLDINDADIKKDCFHVEGYPQAADCEVLKYVMKDISAFNKDEEYMLAASNYRSKIEFELSEYQNFRGETHKFTKTWKSVDKEFKTDKDFGRQLTKKNFFEKNVPPELLVINKDSLTTAKEIYKFVQQHFSWDGKNSTYGRARVKAAFNERKGNAWEINMTLINLLNASGIPTNMMLVSTRQNGLVKTTHPVINDFNYILAKTTINGETYLLDATENHFPFGTLPFRALNHFGRVMDFKKESYWHSIIPKHGSTHVIRGQLKYVPSTKKTKGTLRYIYDGYTGISKNIDIEDTTEEDYIDQLEESLPENSSIVSYEFNEEKNTPLKVQELLHFEVDNMFTEKMVYLNPFCVTFFKTNPFLSEERSFPVDFGYKRKYLYTMNVEVPVGYTVQELPKNKHVKFGGNLGSLSFSSQQNKNLIVLSFNLALNETHIKSDNYPGLKELFKYVTDIQNNSLIVFKKTE